MNISNLFACLVLGSASLLAQAAPENCPAIDCDCSAYSQPSWRSICEAREQTIRTECVQHNGEPQNYCRLHGPAGKPVAVSTPDSDLQALPDSFSDFQLKALKSQVATAQWSISEDLKAAVNYQQALDFAKLYQTIKILESNSTKLFQLQRETLQGLELTQDKEHITQAAREYDAHWRAKASALETLSDSVLRVAGDNKKQQQVGFRVSRLAANMLEFSGHVLAQAGMHQEAAKSWQLAASVSEQSVMRSDTMNLDTRFTEFYREQASARWYRATWHWVEGEKGEESQISFQNAGEVLLSAPSATVAGAETAE